MDITVLQREKIGCLPSWMPMTRPLDKVVWSCLRPVGQDYPPLGTSSYAVRHTGPFGLVAQLDSNVRDRDALECSYEMRPPSCWRRPPGRSGQTWLHQIGVGSMHSLHPQECDLADGRGRSRWTISVLRASAAKAFRWWWWALLTFVSSVDQCLIDVMLFGVL